MRLGEIDVIRGLAVVGMVFYHLLVDLEMFGGWKIGVYECPIVLLGRLTGSTFVFLLGVSAYLQFEKNQSTKPFIKRSLVLLLWAMVITLVTYLIFPEQFIWFGILHLLGTSLILLIPLARLGSNKWLFLIGLIVLVSGLIINIPTTSTLDWYPVIPWFGVVVWGFLAGRVYLPWRKGISWEVGKLSWLQVIGRNSLLIYLVHQPVMVGVIYFIKIYIQ